MNQKEYSAPNSIEEKRGNWFSDTLLPLSAIFLVIKLFGLVGALVAGALYFALKSRVGPIIATLLAFVGAGFVSIVLIALIVAK